jgi:membrane protein YqaA with SNARE-associated domain
MMTEQKADKQVSKTGRYVGLSILVGMFFISVVGSVFLVLNFKYIAELESQGLVGLFIISIFAGSPLPIPTPNMILTFTLGSILNPVYVALVAGFGNGVGNMLVYLTGRGGFMFFRNLGVYMKKEEGQKTGKQHWTGRIISKLKIPEIQKWAQQRALLSVLIFSMYPNPFLMPIIITMGAKRYSFWRFFLAVWAGKTVEAGILSFLGYFGLRSLLRYFGVFQLP